MKKVLTFITLLLTVSAFAVEYKYADSKAAVKNGYEAVLAYFESVDSIAEGETIGNLTVEQLKLVSIMNIKASAAHYGKSAQFATQEKAAAKEMLHANLTKLTDAQVFQIADRVGDFELAVTKFNTVKISLMPQEKINFAIKFYKVGVLSKDLTIAALLDASDDIIKDQWFPALAKAVDSIPVRGTDGKAFMTDEQKKEFYGNFKSLNKVTKASADFLGAVVTQYNLVK